MMSRVGRSMACGVVAMLREKGGVGRTRCPRSREERSQMGSEEHNSSWVAVDVEKMLADDNPCSRIMEAARWEAQYIYRVPEWLKGTNSKAYQPQLVSLGPFHHGDPNLVPMEEHKSRALVHLINRSQKPIQDFISAIDVVAEVLQAAYGLDLHFERPKNRRRFVELMLRDGCFLLEMMTCPFTDYELHDPVFSKRSWKCIYSILRSDVLLMENQLPLLVLKKIVGVVQRPDSPAYGINTDINRMVLECRGQAHEGHDIVEVMQEVALDRNINLLEKVQYAGGYAQEVMQEVMHWRLCRLRFLGREVEGHDMSNMSLRPHPLEIYHGSLTYKEDAHGVRKTSQEYKYEIMPSALEIHEAGIKFSKSEGDSLLDIHFDFKRGVLTMPVLWVVDDTESLYLNLMAFERLHGGTGNLVTSYVICMDAMIVSAKDVARLRSSGLLMNMLGCDEETAKLFNGTLNRGQLLGRCHDLHKVQCDVKAYCSQPWHKWRATLMRTHFKNPWALVSLAAAVVLLVATLVQTIYAVMAGKS